jgi:cytochrome o ubiquinol oxidase subunit 2
LDPGKPLSSKGPALEVQVVALDWKWLFIYPEQGVASVNRLIIPAGAPVRFTLTSSSVMNAFFVPQLGSMIYAMHGMATTLHLQADRPVTLRGLSSQFSGDGFSDMDFEVLAVPPAQFEAWVRSTRSSGPALDATAYGRLARQTRDVTPFTYRAVRPGLFDAVVAREIAAGPGPQVMAPRGAASHAED